MNAKMYLMLSKSGITKIVVTALVAAIIIGSAVGAYAVFQSFSPSTSPTPTVTTSPTATPNSSPNPTITTPTSNANSTPTTSTTTPTPSAGQTQNPTPIPTIVPTPSPTSLPAFINVTGYALYELSQTEFVFSGPTQTYNVTMDLNTRAINLNGKLLGGYQIVSAIIPVTSLQLTITGTVTGSTIQAQTVLIPTTKDVIT